MSTLPSPGPVLLAAKPLGPGQRDEAGIAPVL